MTPRTTAAAKDLDQNLPDWKLAYRIPEAAAATGLGESTIWKRIAAGKLTARRDGAVTLIERAELQRYVHELPKVQPGAKEK